jgi:hypothetical protein
VSGATGASLKQHPGLLEQLAGRGHARIAVAEIGGAAREHEGAAHERRVLTPAQQEHLDPGRAVAHEDHGGGVARRREHASL